MARPKARIPGVVSFEKSHKIPVEELHYDLDNIRILHVRPKNESEAEQILWEMPDMELLYDDIKKRGLQEEVIIDSKNNVLEGNRRLAICKRLHKKQNEGEQILHDFTKILCKEFEPSVTDLDKKAYLTQIHVAGKHEWDDYNQSVLLTELHDEKGLSFETIAAIALKSKPTIIKKIGANYLVQEYHKLHKDDKEWSSKFPHMWEFLRKDLDEIRDDPDKRKLFMRLLYENRILNSRHVRHLKIIFDTPKLLRALESDGMNSALNKLNELDPTIKSATYKRIFNVTKLLQSFPIKEFSDTIMDEHKIAMLQELKNSAEYLLKQIQTVKRENKRK